MYCINVKLKYLSWKIEINVNCYKYTIVWTSLVDRETDNISMQWPFNKINPLKGHHPEIITVSLSTDATRHALMQYIDVFFQY